MPNIYNSYASQLQSRISRRANLITENTMWKVGYRHLGRMKDWRESKVVLTELECAQRLDKKLLQLAHVAAREWEIYHNYDDGELWLEGN
jgi:hypothetical protein